MTARGPQALDAAPADHMAQISAAELQLLSRLCQVGGTRAGRALATILGEAEVQVSLYDAGLREHALAAGELGSGQARLVGVLFDLVGSFEGHLTILLDEAGALALAGRLLCTEAVLGPDQALAADAHGTLAEVGNIVASAFLNAFADALRTPWLPSPPRLIHDRGEAILDALRARSLADRALTIAMDARLAGAGGQVRGQLLFLPSAPVLSKLVRAVRPGGQG